MIDVIETQAALDANDSHGFLAPTSALFRPGLTGTNVGCDTSSCGACTVLGDGRSA